MNSVVAMSQGRCLRVMAVACCFYGIPVSTSFLARLEFIGNSSGIHPCLLICAQRQRFYDSSNRESEGYGNVRSYLDGQRDNRVRR
jgi:hypothetical protein